MGELKFEPIFSEHLLWIVIMYFRRINGVADGARTHDNRNHNLVDELI